MKKNICCNKEYLMEICPCYLRGKSESEDRKRLGIGVGLLIASVPIIFTYILFHFGYHENYDLSLFVTYTLATIISLLIIKKYKSKKCQVDEVNEHG